MWCLLLVVVVWNESDFLSFSLSLSSSFSLTGIPIYLVQVYQASHAQEVTKGYGVAKERERMEERKKEKRNRSYRFDTNANWNKSRFHFYGFFNCIKHCFKPDAIILLSPSLFFSLSNFSPSREEEKEREKESQSSILIQWKNRREEGGWKESTNLSSRSWHQDFILSLSYIFHRILCCLIWWKRRRWRREWQKEKKMTGREGGKWRKPEQIQLVLNTIRTSQEQQSLNPEFTKFFLLSILSFSSFLFHKKRVMKDGRNFLSSSLSWRWKRGDGRKKNYKPWMIDQIEEIFFSLFAFGRRTTGIGGKEESLLINNIYNI